VIGTLTYMSPEQARAKNELVDGRSDVFAVGATLFHAISGKLPRADDTPLDQLVAAVREPIVSLGSVRADLPKRVIHVVDRAVAFDAKERWPDARTMQAHVRAALRGAGRPPAPRSDVRLRVKAGETEPTPVTASMIVEPAKPPPRRHRRG
jgi:serine/threonine-protein kinase